MQDLIEFAAPVRAGDSGGPVVDESGRVVGLTTAATVNFRMGPVGQGFAIPINQARAIADQIRAGARSDTVHIGPPTLLGVGIPLDSQRRGGVAVSGVLRDGPADHAGHRGGGARPAHGGGARDAAHPLTDVLDRRYPGDVVDVTWIDPAGQQRSGTATLVAAA